MQKSIHSEDYQHLLHELKALRTRLDINQTQLAAALGQHQTFVSKVETGVRRLDVIELRLWLAALGEDFPAFCGQLDARLARHGRPPSSAKRR